MRRQLTLLLCIFFFATGFAQRPYTEADARRYADRRADSTLWDRELLAEEVEWFEEGGPGNLPLALYPIPVPSYDWGYESSRLLEWKLDGRRLTGISVGFAYDAYRRDLQLDTAHFYHNYFNYYF